MNQSHKSMLTYVSPDGWYGLAYPDTWEAEAEDDCTSFYKKYCGVGALQISAFEAETPQSAKDSLIDYIGEEQGVVSDIETWVSDKRQQTAFCVLKNTDSFTKVWFIAKGNYIVFITYTCDLSVEGVEDKDVNTILDSLRISD